MTKKVIPLGLVSLVLGGTFLFLSIPLLHAPASQDDFWNFESARRLPETKIPLFYRGEIPHLEHPPLYLYLLGFFLRNFGPTLEVGRSLGILTACLTVILFFCFCLIFYRNERHCFLLSFFSGLMLATSPMLIQGAQLIDIDGTVLLFSFSLLAFGWILFGGSSSLKAELGIGALFALALWSKLVTPLFLPLGILGSLFVSRRVKNVLFLKPFGIGLLFFSGTWFIYCLRFGVLSSFWDLIGYHFGAAHVLFVQKASSTFSLSKSFSALVRLGGWFSWPFLLLLGMGWFDHGGRRGDSLVLRSLLNAILLASVSYLFTKGLSFSFPKYHIPFLPLFCLIAAWPLRSIHFQRQTIYLFLISLLGLTLFQVLAIGDFLFPLLFGLRQGVLEGKEMEVAIQLFQKSLFSFLAFLCAWKGVHLVAQKKDLRQTFFLTLGAMALATNLSQAILQSRAPYTTGNLYGDSSRKEVIALLKEALRPGDVLIAHDLIHFELGSFASPFVAANLWGDPEAILNLIEKEKARALVYSLSIHTLSQYRNTFLNREFQDHLRRSFERVDVGTYTVWLRKNWRIEKRLSPS